MSFTFQSLSLPEVMVASPEVYEDERGQLLESYDKAVFEEAGITEEFVLDFYSRSQSNVIRGLHVQVEPGAQAKLVHVISGQIFDVVVDIRQNSDTFGEYVTRTMSGREKEILYVPTGFAHGYLVQEDETIVHYKGSYRYSPEHIKGLAWNDPHLNIDWPLTGGPILSEQDKEWPTLEAWQS